MSRSGQVFVDTGAWLALALVRDGHHREAVDIWTGLLRRGARLSTSIPVVIETFTFLERNAPREVALRWRLSVDDVRGLSLLECTRADLAASWRFFERKALHRLSAVDATSFAIMQRARIRSAFAFDVHFQIAGFDLATD